MGRYGNTSEDKKRSVPSVGYITTVAGNGVCGFWGDGYIATNAKLSDPYGVCKDSKGDLYIADCYNHRVRKANAAGIITTVAGNGTAGFGGDGGSAISAKLYYPEGVWADGAGNLYIADTHNHRVRKVDTLGTITTVAGSSGTGGFWGDGGQATSAGLNYPQGVCGDGAGNLYIADTANYRVRKVDTLGTITTVVGNGWYNICYPDGVWVDGTGNLYIAEAYNNRVSKRDSTGIITTVAGSGGTGGFWGDGGTSHQCWIESSYRGVW